MGALGWMIRSVMPSFTDASARRKELTAAQEQDFFFNAIERDDTDTIARIARKYPQDFPGWRNHKGHSPLQAAQDWNSFQSFHQLVALGADKDEDYGNGWTPLMTALAKRDSAFIDYILRCKPDVNGIARDGNKSYTALHLAVDADDEALVMELIELGASGSLKAAPRKGGVEITAEEYAQQKGKTRMTEMIGLADEIRAVKERETAALKAMLEQSAPKPEPAPVMAS